ncbi:MAG: hypothetical protein AAB263_07775 [Planctomycetota bacterium]
MWTQSRIIGSVALCGALLPHALSGFMGTGYPDLTAGVVLLGAAGLWLLGERTRAAAQRRPVAVRIRQ